MSRVPPPFQLLELNVISAQDLAPVARSMRTYAVAWIHPDRKLSTRVDTHGHKNPTWNDKFVFRVDEEFLYSDTSAITIDIYALHWFKDIFIGSVRALISNLIHPPSNSRSTPFHRNTANPMGMRFGALQVRKPSGRPQGILNIGVAVLDSSLRSMPLYTHDSSALGYRHLMGEADAYDNHNHLSPRKLNLSPRRCVMPELRRVKSEASSMISLTPQQQQQQQQQPIYQTDDKPSSDDTSNGNNRKSRTRSKASSMISGSEGTKRKGKSGKSRSVISDSGLRWRAKKEDQNKGNKLGNPSSKAVHTADPTQIAQNREPERNLNLNISSDEPSSLTSESEATNYRSGTTEKLNALEKQRIIQKNVYDVMASPKPQFRNSPARMIQQQQQQQPVGYGGSRKNTPKHPAVDFGGSRKATPRGTPMHAAMGKMNPAFEYATPRRSNLAGPPPPVMSASELGPSPSEVAEALATFPRADEGESSIVDGWSLDESVEGLDSKLERWRTELPPIYDRGELSSYAPSSKKISHNRRRTDGGSGLFSCFSNICGCQCTIVVGGGKGKKKAAGRRRSLSADDGSFI